MIDRTEDRRSRAGDGRDSEGQESMRKAGTA